MPNRKWRYIVLHTSCSNLDDSLLPSAVGTLKFLKFYNLQWNLVKSVHISRTSYWITGFLKWQDDVGQSPELLHLAGVEVASIERLGNLLGVDEQLDESHWSIWRVGKRPRLQKARKELIREVTSLEHRRFQDRLKWEDWNGTMIEIELKWEKWDWIGISMN